MVVRRKKKSRKALGYKTHFGGVGGKQHRGKGSRGGKGRAGHGKRAAHMRLFWLKRDQEPKKKKRIKVINLNQLDQLKGDTIDLTKLGYDKLLGTGKVTRKINVKVKSCSKKAKEKLEKAGGSLL